MKQLSWLNQNICLYARACARVYTLLLLSLVLCHGAANSAEKPANASHHKHHSAKTQRTAAEGKQIRKNLETSNGQDAAAYLNDADAKTREAAVIAIGRDKEFSAQADLKDLAQNDDDIAVRSAAIQGLGTHQQGMNDLKTILESENEPVVVRQSAASAIALFTDPQAVEILGSNYNSAEGELKEHIRICLMGLRGRFPEQVEQILGGPDAQ